MYFLEKQRWLPGGVISNLVHSLFVLFGRFIEAPPPWWQHSTPRLLVPMRWSAAHLISNNASRLEPSPVEPAWKWIEGRGWLLVLFGGWLFLGGVKLVFEALDLGPGVFFLGVGRFFLWSTFSLKFLNLRFLQAVRRGKKDVFFFFSNNICCKW